jgi:hypothetical protein
MDDNRVLARLGRIASLDRDGVASGELLAELRELLREAEEAEPAVLGGEEVVERLRTAPHGT